MPSLALSEALAAPCHFVSTKPFWCWSAVSCFALFHDSSALRALHLPLLELALPWLCFRCLGVALACFAPLWLALACLNSHYFTFACFASLCLCVSFLRSTKSKNVKRGELK